MCRGPEFDRRQTHCCLKALFSSSNWRLIVPNSERDSTSRLNIFCISVSVGSSASRAVLRADSLEAMFLCIMVKHSSHG